MTREDFTIEANSRGYTISYKGKSIGGVGIIGKFKGRGKAVTAQISEYRRQAESDIAKILSGYSGHYLRMLNEINKEGRL